MKDLALIILTIVRHGPAGTEELSACKIWETETPYARPKKSKRVKFFVLAAHECWLSGPYVYLVSLRVVVGKFYEFES
jgi:hypothetical protein